MYQKRGILHSNDDFCSDALAQLKRLEAEVNKEVLKLGLGDTPSTDKLIQGWTGPAQLESGEVYWSCTTQPIALLIICLYIHASD